MKRALGPTPEFHHPHRFPDTIDQHGATDIAKKDQRNPWNKFLKCPEVFYNGVDT